MEKLHPFGMSRVQFVLSIDELEGLVIRLEDQMLRFEVMNPMCQSSEYGIKLLIISAVITLRSMSFSLIYAIGHLVWIRTSPIPTPLPSHYTSNKSSKLGNARTNA